MFTIRLEAEDSARPEDVGMDACIFATRHGLRTVVKYLDCIVIALPHNCPINLSREVKKQCSVDGGVAKTDQFTR